MVFTTIGLAISNAFKSNPNSNIPDKPNNNKNSIQDKIKEGLKKLAEYLFEIAKKSATALPGIIASIVSFVLKSAGNLISFAAEHIKLFLITVVTAIVYGLISYVKN